MTLQVNETWARVPAAEIVARSEKPWASSAGGRRFRLRKLAGDPACGFRKRSPAPLIRSRS